MFYDVILTTDHATFENCLRVFNVHRIDNLNVFPVDIRLQKHVAVPKNNGSVLESWFLPGK